MAIAFVRHQRAASITRIVAANIVLHDYQKILRSNMGSKVSMSGKGIVMDLLQQSSLLQNH